MPPSPDHDTCIFCRFVTGHQAADEVWRDEHHLAFLDSSPCAPGHVLLIPNSHVTYLFAMSDEQYQRMLAIAKRMAGPLATTMGSKRVGMVAEGFGISHVHLHLIPISKGGDLSPTHQMPAAASELVRIAALLRSAFRDV